MNPYLLIVPVAATLLLALAMWRWMELKAKGVATMVGGSLTCYFFMIYREGIEMALIFSLSMTGLALSMFLTRRALADLYAAWHRGVPAESNSLPRRAVAVFWGMQILVVPVAMLLPL
ncbi:hypothetical protein ABZX85_10980 [Streptomyces sp. NPDC004539]|uniref:hypothetical protein n=1 Tax=Streptomyces sp. NPDC004539 TaxID=3154280 RepID=UPI0033B690BF